MSAGFCPERKSIQTEEEKEATLGPCHGQQKRFSLAGLVRSCPGLVERKWNLWKGLQKERECWKEESQVGRLKNIYMVIHPILSCLNPALEDSMTR